MLARIPFYMVDVRVICLKVRSDFFNVIGECKLLRGFEEIKIDPYEGLDGTIFEETLEIAFCCIGAE